MKLLSHVFLPVLIKIPNSKNNFSFDNRGDLQCKSSFVEKVRRGIPLRAKSPMGRRLACSSYSI
jgi:hypothetical protein